MISEKSKQVVDEVSKVIVGKREVIERVLMTIYAGGHILLEDCPGVGKTTLALAFSKVMGLDYKRIQFTPDTMPSDITGFTMYNKANGNFEFKQGAVFCNMLLGDEINRTSAKTQAALLESMEEGKVTIDGEAHELPNPFVVIATQNPITSAGTQPLPDSQLDRFMVKLSIGYPKLEDQKSILKQRRYTNPLDSVSCIMSKEDIFETRNYLSSINMNDNIMEYLIRLCEATREESMVALGVSPRGVIALSKMAKACAIMRDRDYVTPEDIREVFIPVCAHRLQMKPQARIEGLTAEKLCGQILDDISVSSSKRGR
ncbi:MAG: MoxR family ATPase [bacterium]|nr:MoxR family ATPase [bacterium]